MIWDIWDGESKSQKTAWKLKNQHFLGKTVGWHGEQQANFSGSGGVLPMAFFFNSLKAFVTVIINISYEFSLGLPKKKPTWKIFAAS